MSITLKPYLLKRRQKPTGEIPIYIRITQNRKYSLLSSGISIEEKYWEPGTRYGQSVWIKSNHPSSKALNKKLRSKLAEIRETIDEAGNDINRKQVVKLVQNSDSDTVYRYGIDLSEKLHNDGKYHPGKQLKASVSKFKQFAGKDIRFNEVTPQMLNDFQSWMISDLENHPNTIIKTIGRLKSLFKDAYKNDITTNRPFDDPKFEKVKSVDTKKQALSFDQIQDIEKLDLEGNLWHYRNYFLFSFWNAGIRFTDLALLRWKNIIDGRLIYQMGKNKKQKNIPLLPQAIEILDHYRDDQKKPDDFIFPIISDKNLTPLGLKKKASSQNAMVNKGLKDIQKLAKIQTTISFHTSRHSFSRWAKENKFDIDWIGKALAHSKRATTERYLNSLSEYNLDEGMMRLAEISKAKK